MTKPRALPAMRRVLLERVARSLGGTRPLTRESEASDRAAFESLVALVIAPAGLRGGAAMCEAVTKRARIVMKNTDDDLSPQGGIVAMLSKLPNKAVRIGYLLELRHSEYGENYRSAVLSTLLELVKSVSTLTDLLPSGSGHEEFADAVNDLRLRIGDDALGEEINVLISKKLDRILNQDESAAADSPLPEEIPPEPAKTPARKSADTRVYTKGEVIFNENDPGDEAFMIASGEVEISIRAGGETVVLANLGRGEIFGEMALIDNEPRMATATAIEDTTVSIVPQEVFKKRLARLAEEDRLISHVMEVFVARLRQQVLH